MGTEEQKGLVTTEGSRPLTVVVQVPAEIVMYNVSESDLDSLASGASSNAVHLTFLGVSIGAVLSIGTVLVTVRLEMLALAAFVALLGVSLVLSVYFAIRAASELSANNRRFEHIKNRRSTNR